MLILTRKTGHDDGFGAQYQRIIGTYCICKSLGIAYHHTPFKDIWYQGLESLERNSSSQEYVDDCNNRVSLSSDIDITAVPNLQIMELDKISRDALIQIEERCQKEEINLLLRIDTPYSITDMYPDMYEFAKNLYTPVVEKNSVFTIGVHVRRGELYVVDCDRMLPNSFYIDITNRVIKLCHEHGVQFVIELYTEVATKPFVVTGKHPGICERIQNDVTVDPKQNKIAEFDSLPNLKKFINEDTLLTFDRMINSDILITSRSSFSASASYIKEGLSIYHEFWHSMLDKDIEYRDPLFDQKISLFIESTNKR